MLGKFVQVYMDDIFTFPEAKEEHLIQVRMVLETLKHHHLYAKDSNSFWQDLCRFFGHVIS